MTACHCANAGVRAADGTIVPVVIVHIEHPGVYSEDMAFPYWKDEHAGIVLGQPTIVEREYQVFTTS
jgi:hypothetical protein